MAYTISLKNNVVRYRKKGYSIRELAAKFRISQGTSSLWCTGIMLDKNARDRLAKKRILGQYKAIQASLNKRQLAQKERLAYVSKYLSQISMSKEFLKLACALLFWCEGSKTEILVKFTNSDPSLIKTYLALLRSGFDLDESKFRALVHIHSYHDDVKQKKFWSEVTTIPIQQFNRSYRKPNTGTRIRTNYPGCISVTYYDASLAKELKTIYNLFSQRGVV